MTVAILGLGRSGVSVAKAAVAMGYRATVFDERPADGQKKTEVVRDLVELGVDVVAPWSSEFEDVDLVVTSPGVPRANAKLQRAVRRGIEVISEVEFAYRIAKAPIVAITGTNGKSTTTVMTYLCLRACGEQAILCGNIYGSGYDEIPLTEAAANASPDAVLVAEISSFQLEWIRDFRPVCAGITNVWPDHLDRYEGLADYAATKQRIFENQDPEHYAVVKAHDPVVKVPVGPTVLTFGAIGEHAQIDQDRINILNLKLPVHEMAVSEPHNFQNAAMAALLAYGYLRYRAANEPESSAARLLATAEEAAVRAKAARETVYTRRPDQPARMILPPEILDGLREFKGLAHRMEWLPGERDGVRVVNNSMCTNPDAVIKSAMSIKEPKHILLGGTNKRLDFKPLRNYLANRQHRAYLFGRDAAALNEMLGGEFPVFETMSQAFRAAASAARRGEVIMLAPGCASLDQFEDFRDRGNVFKEIAKEWLES